VIRRRNTPVVIALVAPIALLRAWTGLDLVVDGVAAVRRRIRRRRLVEGSS